MGRASWIRVAVAASTIAACFSYVHYSTTEQHSIVHPSIVAFGNSEIGTTTNRSITISPAAGEQNDLLNSIVEQMPDCPNFSISFPNGPPPTQITSTCAEIGSGTGGSGTACQTFSTTSLTFEATFAPTVQGAQTCVLIVTSNGSTTSTITLTGTGVLPPIDVKLEIGGSRCGTGCVLPLGDTNVGKNATVQSVTVVNAGSGTAMLTSVTTSPPFSIVSGNGSRTLGPNASETFTVTCSPLSDDPFADVLTIVSNDPDAPSQTVALDCRGVISNIDPSPNALTMTTRVGQVVTTPLSLENTSASPITVDELIFDTAGFSITGINPGAVILPGAANKANGIVSFDPSVSDLVNPIGNLTVKFDGTSTREVVINGPVKATTLSLAPIGPPNTANLGAVCVGGLKVEPFTLLATSDGDFLLQSLTIVVGGEFYTITPRVPATPATLAMPHLLEGNGGTSVQFDVEVRPTTVGPVSGTFTMSTDIPKSVPFGVGLIATALPLGANVTPQGPVDFGTVKVGETSAPTKITFTNCSAAAITLSGATIVGDQDFSIGAIPTMEVGPNASVDIEILLTPRFGGVKLASLEIAHPDGISAVSFIGNGDGPPEVEPPEPPDPRDTYYRCSAGGATGASPLLLAVLFVLRRRKRAPR
jgi:uncharacterized protein (TIGR03382 family)